MSSKLFVICIGGSGAKCFEAITQLAAAGLYNEQSIEVLFVDPDEANGSMERARHSLNTYQQCQRLMGGEQRQANVPWMQTPEASVPMKLKVEVGDGEMQRRAYGETKFHLVIKELKKKVRHSRITGDDINARIAALDKFIPNKLGKSVKNIAVDIADELDEDDLFAKR